MKFNAWLFLDRALMSIAVFAVICALVVGLVLGAKISAYLHFKLNRSGEVMPRNLACTEEK